MSNPIKRGLSRGLDSLLSDRAKSLAEQINTTLASDDLQPGALRHLALDDLHTGQYQPRQHFDEASLAELANSIRSQGMIEPIIVRCNNEKSYEIIAGERRWRAARLAGLTTVPSIVRELTDQTALVISLVENLQRQDLNVIEEAVGLQRLIDEFKVTQQDLASLVGKNRSTISNCLRLLKLTTEVKELLQNGSLEMGHARALLALTAAQQVNIANKVVQKKLSVRETEQLVKQLLTPLRQKSNTEIDPDVRYLENSLAEKLAARVLIQHRQNGSGKLEIYYHSLDSLQGILARIK